MGMSLPGCRREMLSPHFDIAFVDDAIVIEAKQLIRIRVLRSNTNLYERVGFNFESVSDTGIEVGAWMHNITFYPGDDCVELAWPLFIAPSIKSGIYQFSFILNAGGNQIQLVRQLVLICRPLSKVSLSWRTYQVRLLSMAGFLSAMSMDTSYH